MGQFDDYGSGAIGCKREEKKEIKKERKKKTTSPTDVGPLASLAQGEKTKADRQPNNQTFPPHLP